MPSPKHTPNLGTCAKCGMQSHPRDAWPGGIDLCASCRAVCVDKMAVLIGAGAPRDVAQAIIARELLASRIIRERTETE